MEKLSLESDGADKRSSPAARMGSIERELDDLLERQRELDERWKSERSR